MLRRAQKYFNTLCDVVCFFSCLNKYTETEQKYAAAESKRLLTTTCHLGKWPFVCFPFSSWPTAHILD